MWTCPDCGAVNSPGMDSCCGLPKSAQKPRSTAKVKLAVDAKRKLVKPRQQGTGQSRRYCVVCGLRVYPDNCIRRRNTEYIHHQCVEAVYG